MPTRVTNKGGGFEIYSGDGKLFVGKKVMFREGEVEELKNVCESDESLSSIGKNSDVSEKSCDGEEVQSSYKGPLDAMEALEEVLPIRRGISRFYKGKSKSFASLGDASSIKDMSKPENAYMRKRRNMVASWDKARIAKRVPSRTTVALALAMTNADNASWRSFSFADLHHISNSNMNNPST